MISSFQKFAAGALLATSALAAAPAQAAFPVYGSPGTENPALYSFTAFASGDIVAYFAGANAGDVSELGLIVNGSDDRGSGLPNNTANVGDSFNFGAVNAGDTLLFYLKKIVPAGDVFYSDKSLNADGYNHIFASAYSGGDAGIPAGIFASFEDLPGGGDLDYNDLSFVFTNVSGVPEPTTWAMMLAGFGAVGFAMRRRRDVRVSFA